jgi:hypothetical protein
MKHSIPFVLTKDYVSHLRNSMELGQDYANQFRVKDTSIPSGPDSSKFRASVMGSAKLVENYAYYSSGSLTPTVYKYFLKLGNGIPHAAQNQATEIVLGSIEDMFDGLDISLLPCTLTFKNHTVRISRTYGTNFNGIGIVIRNI